MRPPVIDGIEEHDPTGRIEELDFLESGMPSSRLGCPMSLKPRSGRMRGLLRSRTPCLPRDSVPLFVELTQRDVLKERGRSAEFYIKGDDPVDGRFRVQIQTCLMSNLVGRREDAFRVASRPVTRVACGAFRSVGHQQPD